MKIDAPGITLDLPPGWEAEVDSGSGEAPPDAPRLRTQAFFHVGRRAFVLYVVLAERIDRAPQVDEVNRVLAGITIHP
jgi:hypothetical protein